MAAAAGPAAARRARAGSAPAAEPVAASGSAVAAAAAAAAAAGDPSPPDDLSLLLSSTKPVAKRTRRGAQMQPAEAWSDFVPSNTGAEEEALAGSEQLRALQYPALGVATDKSMKKLLEVAGVFSAGPQAGGSDLHMEDRSRIALEAEKAAAVKGRIVQEEKRAAAREERIARQAVQKLDADKGNHSLGPAAMEAAMVAAGADQSGIDGDGAEEGQYMDDVLLDHCTPPVSPPPSAPPIMSMSPPKVAASAAEPKRAKAASKASTSVSPPKAAAPAAAKRAKVAGKVSSQASSPKAAAPAAPKRPKLVRKVSKLVPPPKAAGPAAAKRAKAEAVAAAATAAQEAVAAEVVAKEAVNAMASAAKAVAVAPRPDDADGFVAVRNGTSPTRPVPTEQVVGGDGSNRFALLSDEEEEAQEESARRGKEEQTEERKAAAAIPPLSLEKKAPPSSSIAAPRLMVRLRKASSQGSALQREKDGSFVAPEEAAAAAGRAAPVSTRSRIQTQTAAGGKAAVDTTDHAPQRRAEQQVERFGIDDQAEVGTSALDTSTERRLVVLGSRLVVLGGEDSAEEDACALNASTESQQARHARTQAKVARRRAAQAASKAARSLQPAPLAGRRAETQVSTVDPEATQEEEDTPAAAAAATVAEATAAAAAAPAPTAPTQSNTPRGASRSGHGGQSTDAAARSRPMPTAGQRRGRQRRTANPQDQDDTEQEEEDDTHVTATAAAAAAAAAAAKAGVRAKTSRGVARGGKREAGAAAAATPRRRPPTAAAARSAKPSSGRRGVRAAVDNSEDGDGGAQAANGGGASESVTRLESFVARFYSDLPKGAVYDTLPTELEARAADLVHPVMKGLAEADLKSDFVHYFKLFMSLPRRGMRKNTRGGKRAHPRTISDALTRMQSVARDMSVATRERRRDEDGGPSEVILGDPYSSRSDEDDQRRILQEVEEVTSGSDSDGGEVDVKAGDRLLRRVERLVANGHVSRAARVLASVNGPVPIDEAVQQQLKDKFPTRRRPDEPLPVPQDMDNGEQRVVLVSEEQVELALSRSANGAAPGPSGWTGELLKAVCARPENLVGLTSLIDKVVNNHEFVNDLEVRALLLASTLSAHSKPKQAGAEAGPAPSVRPIAAGEVLYKIAGRVLTAQIGPSVAKLLRPVQCGVGVPGAAQKAHAALQAAVNSIGGGALVLKTDARNAFNSLERDKLLERVFARRELSALWPLVQLAYGGDPTYNLWFERGGVPAGELLCSNGVMQGDVIAPWLYCIAVRSAYEAAVSAAGGAGVNDDGHLLTAVAIADDFIIAAAPERAADVGAAVTELRKELALLSIEMAPEKQSLLQLQGVAQLPPESSSEEEEDSDYQERQRRRRRSSAGARGRDMDGQAVGEAGLVVRAARLASVFGIPLSLCDGDVGQFCQDMVEQHSTFFLRLKDSRLHRQSANLLLRMCAVPKMGYVARCVPPALLAAAARDFDRATLAAAAEVYGLAALRAPAGDAQEDEEDMATFTTAALLRTPIRLGGLGIASVVRSSPHAYVAHVAATAVFVDEMTDGKGFLAGSIHALDAVCSQLQACQVCQQSSRPPLDSDDDDPEDDHAAPAALAKPQCPPDVHLPDRQEVLDDQEVGRYYCNLAKESDGNTDRCFLKMQSKLWHAATLILHNCRLAHADSRACARIRSSACTLGSRFLTCFPLSEPTRMSNVDWQTAVRLRFGVADPLAILCRHASCQKRLAGQWWHPLICTLQRKRGCEVRHNSVVRALEAIANRATGLTVQHENHQAIPRGPMKEAAAASDAEEEQDGDPSRDVGKLARPDIVLIRRGGLRWLVDVSVSTAVADSYQERAAHLDGATAKQRERQKEQAYRQALLRASRVSASAGDEWGREQLGGDSKVVFPFVLETHGRFGAQAKLLLGRLADQFVGVGCNDKSKERKRQRFVAQAVAELSVALQVGNAGVIYSAASRSGAYKYPSVQR
jgi:hypothetical protein